MPSWQRSSAVVSVSLHIAVALAWPVIASIPPALTLPAAPPMREIARIEMPVSEPPLLVEHAIPPEELSGYDISGLPFNLAKIDARRASLFPFLTADLTFIERMATDVRAEAARLGNPLDPALAATALELKPPLLQQVVDESWSRRDRWQRFQQIRALLVGHDAHDGDAPALMRGYLDQNLLQPYCDGKSKDGQFWALLENATEHVDFLEFIRSYARTRSSSRTTTELLFLMDELAQGNREVAEVVLGISVGHDLAYSATIAPNAARLAASIANDLHTWIAAHGFTRHEGVGAAYDQLRLRVLATIVETSPHGYRESDARYLGGEIFFRQGNFDQALEWWRPMRPQAGDSYAAAATAIRELIDRGNQDTGAVRRVLWKQSAFWKEQNYRRLRQFGYRCDSY
jgi:hypothetical protein